MTWITVGNQSINLEMVARVNVTGDPDGSDPSFVVELFMPGDGRAVPLKGDEAREFLRQFELLRGTSGQR